MARSASVSVILTSYNHAKYLRQAIESVLNQTFSDFELIVWDDASTDESWQIIRSYSDKRVHAIRNDFNRGGTYLNEAISQQSKGKYLAIHHSDDIWELDKLEKQVAFLEGHPAIGAVFTNATIIGEEGDLFEDQSHFYYSIFDQPNRSRHEWLNHFFYHGNALCHPSVLIRRACYDECGLYRIGLHQLDDLDMWVRLCLKYEIHVLPEKLARFRVRSGEANVSGNRPEARIRGQFENFNILQRYREIQPFEDLVKVFPDAEAYRTPKGYDLGFALGMIAVEAKVSGFTELFGLELLLDALSDAERAIKIRDLYGFGHREFVALTAQHDVFASESVERLAQKEQALQTVSAQLIERDQALEKLAEDVAEKDQALQSLSKDVAEKEQALQSLSKDVAEKEQVAEKLARIVGERNQDLRALAAQLSGRRQVVETLAQEVVRLASGDRLQDLRLNLRQWYAMLFPRGSLQFRLARLCAGGLYLTVRFVFRLLNILGRTSLPGDHLRRGQLGYAVRTLLATVAGRVLHWRGTRRLARVVSAIVMNGLGVRPLAAEVTLVKSSEFFDPYWYLAQNPDVLSAGWDPALHYLLKGGFEGRDPGPTFSSTGYLQTYADVGRAGLNPLVHYIKYGKREGRQVTGIPSQRQSGVRILVMDWRVPMPDVSAGERATFGILQDLCTIGYDVVFLPADLKPAGQYRENLARLGVSVIDRFAGYFSPTDYIRAEGHTFSVFYLIRVAVAEQVLGAIRRISPGALVLFHLPDVHFVREAREAELRNDPVLRAKAEQMRERELSIVGQVNRSVVVSAEDQAALHAYAPDAPISVFPVLYSHVVPNPRPYETRSDIFFLGGYEHNPNVDAVRWFSAEIWPLVRQELPDVVFHIVGSKPPPEVLELGEQPGIKVDGFVQDLEAFLSAMRVGIAPLRYGAGIKGKLGMTLGAGIPAVCTPIAAEGLHAEDGEHVLLAEDPRAFARAVVSLYTDRPLWERLSSRGRELVKRHFGADANRAALLAVLNDADSLPLQQFVEYCQKLAPRPVPCPTDDEGVDVSIVIPVHNQWEYTRTCINSILEACGADETKYEIILADDSSTDDTITASQAYPGVRVIKTAANVGFLRNCNNAARSARGKYILLLNNDVVVLPGWLSGLHRLAEKDESAAIVGSKMLYPDGTIQEAGAILWDNAIAYNFGRGQPRKAVDCDYVREVDYVSAASILIRKAFWDTVGGFDERYEAAYCEDSDLAMAARARGLRVLYTPASEIIHFESQSYANQTVANKATLQRRNIARLLEKWQDEFATRHRPPDSAAHLGASHAERSPSPSAMARRQAGKQNVLYFSPFPSHPGNHGNQATIRSFGKLLRGMGHRVHFVLLQSDLFSDTDVEAMRAHWDSLDILANSHPMVADGKPIGFDGWYVSGLGEQIGCLCAKYEIDAVICSYVFQSRLLEFVPAHILKVIDTHDKMGGRYEMLRANGQPLEFFSCTPQEEGAYLRRADIVVARREEEARYFDGVSGRATAMVVPHIEEPHFVERRFSQLHHVGSVASANLINLESIRELLRAIERRLRGKRPPFVLHVAGQVQEMAKRLQANEAKLFRKPWVEMHGFVPSMDQFYGQMDLIISPVTMGTGINVKTVQAMAYGMPLITTAWGSKGIRTDDPMHSHTDLDALVESLLYLEDHPQDLERLAGVSRSVYATFFDAGLAAMRGLFEHPKLTHHPNGRIFSNPLRDQSRQTGARGSR